MAPKPLPLKTKPAKELKTWLIFEDEVEEYLKILDPYESSTIVQMGILGFLKFIEKKDKEALEKLKEKPNRENWEE